MAELRKEILRLAIPATLENILQTLVGFLDTLMIARLGLAAVTAVGVSNVILSIYLAVYLAIGVGTSALVARNLGAERKTAAQKMASSALITAAGAGLILGIVSVVSGQMLLSFMGLTAAAVSRALPYFYVVGGLTFLESLTAVLGSIIRATGNTKTPMAVSAVTNIVNVSLDYILIFGIGAWSGLGILGTAIGTVLARLLGLILLLKKLQSTVLKLTPPLNWSGKYQKKLLALTLPAAGERLLMRLGQAVYMGLIVAISAKTYASHNIAGSIESFAYMPAYGLAAAASILSGFALGQNDFAKIRQIGYRASCYGVLILGLFGIFLYFGGRFAAVFLTADSSAIAQVATALKIDGFIQPVLAVSLILTGVLQGLGDTKSPLYSTFFGMWGIRVVGVWFLGQRLNLGIAGV